VLHSDTVWRWNVDNTVTCENFAEALSEAACVESWAFGIAADGTSKIAYDACEVGCPLSDTLRTRTCTTPEPEPEPEPESLDCME
jgi:hypothetical protein